MNWTSLLVVAGAVLSGYSLIESRGRGILNWAVFAVAVALLLELL